MHLAPLLILRFLIRFGSGQREKGELFVSHQGCGAGAATFSKLRIQNHLNQRIDFRLFKSIFLRNKMFIDKNSLSLYNITIILHLLIFKTEAVRLMNIGKKNKRIFLMSF